MHRTSFVARRISPAVLKQLVTLGVGALVIAAGSVASAAVLTYKTTLLGGNDWQYDYVLSADTGLPAFDEFTVYFDPSAYSVLSQAAAPSPWDALLIQPDPGIPADGFFDALKLDGPVSPGSVYSGFSVQFTYHGPGAPGAQRFELVDSSGFAVVGSGQTVSALPQAVPEPNSLLLAATAACLAFVRPRRRA